MSSLVLELQRDAYDSHGSITDLLRKAYTVARKLKIEDFKKWISFELEGYDVECDEIPSYRNLDGELKAWNPYNGWIPVLLDDQELVDFSQKRVYSGAIVGLEEVVNSGEVLFGLAFSNEDRKILSEVTKFDTKFMTFFSITQGKRIVEAVRNAVLEWSLNLEEEGILGEGMRFTEEEKVSAQEIHITNNFNGDVSRTQIQQNTVDSFQKIALSAEKKDQVVELIAMINENKDKIGLNAERITEIESGVRDLERELEVGQPREEYIRKVLGRIGRVTEGVAGNVIAAGLIHMIGLV